MDESMEEAVRIDAKQEKKRKFAPDDNPRLLFIERIRLEGRHREYLDRVKKIKEETGQTQWASTCAAMRQMGYAGAAAERKLRDERRKSAEKSKLRQQVDRERAEIAEERKIEDFEASIRKLPPRAPAAVEIDWIITHPAMNRLDRSADKVKLVIITAEDILQSSAGVAPSQGAVRQLQHWCNAPREFFKMVLGEDNKKRTVDRSQQGVEADESIEDVERLLLEVRGAKP